MFEFLKYTPPKEEKNFDLSFGIPKEESNTQKQIDYKVSTDINKNLDNIKK